MMKNKNSKSEMKNQDRQLVSMPPYPWQAEVWQNFSEAYQAGKLPHAVLLCAQEGLGIETLAVAMAQLVLCKSPKADKACSECKSCLLLRSGSHPDFLMIEPQTDSGQLLVDQIREINHFISQTSQQGDYKVVAVQPAHAMNQSAANALLKNLEEPAGRTLIILVSHKINKLLPTVRSRCRMMKVSAPDDEQALGWLEAQGVVDAGDYLRSAGGSPLEALDWFHNNKLVERQQLLAELEALIENRVTTGALVKRWASMEAEELLVFTMHWLENVIRRKMTGLSAEQGAGSLKVELPLLFRFRDRLIQKSALVQTTANINLTLLLEELAFDLYALGKSTRLLYAG